MAEAPPQRTWFAPVVLAGLGTAAVLAVTSARAWVTLDLPTASRVGLSDADLRADSPLALALALVVLAGWGVVLVTRSRTRRVVLGFAALADLGVLACLVRAPGTLPDQIRTQLSVGDAGATSVTAAYGVAWAVALLSLVAIGQGLRFAPRWPEMSSRYDAPVKPVADAPAAADLADLELWKALDEGRDPTER